LKKEPNFIWSKFKKSWMIFSNFCGLLRISELYIKASISMQMKWHSNILNPKRPGLFDLLDTRGGAESAHFGKRSLKPLNFYFRLTNSVSYKSLHVQLKFDTLLRLLRLKLRPQEVAKVARVQAKKSSIKKSEICNFWATQMLYTSKESREQSSFRFEIKLEFFVYEKFEKNRFCDF
jgi:hypothetical protein